MNRREALKMLGLGVVTPVAALELLKPEPEGGCVIPDHLVGATEEFLREVKANGVVTMWQRNGFSRKFDDVANWSNGVPCGGHTAVFQT